MANVARYQGPQCPRCGEGLLPQQIASGRIDCPYCDGRFEATAFHPPALVIRAVEQFGLGPEGGTACANHARNEAVTSCQRCGLIICALCDMNIGTGTYCPACFDRMRADDALPTAARRYRDWTAMGRMATIVTLFPLFWFVMIIFGGLATYFGIRGVRQRRERGRSIIAPIIVILVGLLEMVASVGLIALMIWSFTQTAGGG